MLLLGVTGCGADAEVEKSIRDVRELVEPVRAAWEEEWRAVEAKDPDRVNSAIEETSLLAEASIDDFERAARRAPAETQDFADAAEDWCQAIIDFNRNHQASGGDESAGAVYLAAVYTYHNKMDEAAKKLEVEPWTPRKT